MKGKPRLTDFPAPTGRKKQSNPLSKTEEEDDLLEDTAADPAADGSGEPSLVKAVLKLTEVASHLAAQKKHDSSLEALLDGAGSAGGG